MPTLLQTHQQMIRRTWQLGYLQAAIIIAVTIALDVWLDIHQLPWWSQGLVIAIGAWFTGRFLMRARFRYLQGGSNLDLENEEYRTVILSLSQGVVVQGLDGRILANNPAAELILGLTGDQLRGRRSIDPEWRTIHTDGSDFPGFEHPAMVTLRTGMPQIGVEMGVHRGDGSLCWIRVSSQPIGEPMRGVVATFVDITTSRAAQQTLITSQATLRALTTLQRAILDAANLSIISTDTSGNILHWNAAATRMLGWTADEMVGKQTPAVIHVQDEIVARAEQLTRELGQTIVPGFDAFVAKTRQTHQADEREWTYVHKDGRRFPVLLSVTAVRDVHGSVTGYLGIAADITERKRLLDDLRASKDAAEAGARAKSDFLATMSHEIRTPMNGIIGMADLLSLTDLSPAQHESLTTIRTCGDALLVLINDILDFSKIESGKLDLEWLQMDIREVAENSVLLLAERAQAKGLELVCRIDRRVPQLFRCDSHRLRQILINLLSNAVKFTDRGDVVLEVALASDGFAVEMTISDTGIGIKPDALARLFTPFTQADASMNRRFGGTGLGLAISRQLAELLGGAITVASELGRGSSFTLRLPLTDAVARTDHELLLANRRILCVEAQPHARSALIDGCSDLGARSDGCAAGPEAFARLRSAAATGQPYHAVIIDRRIPGLDGLQVAQQIQAECPMPVILSTTFAERIADAELASKGLAATVTRPVRMPHLHDALRRLLAADHPTTKRLTRPATTTSTRSLHILVAEDNAVNQKVALAMLHRLQCTCDLVDNGRAALAAIERQPYDLVLMDCQMPDLDGLAATIAWRTREQQLNRPRLTVIALTANAMAEDRERCLTAGMDDYLPKPIRLDALRDMLQRWSPAR